MRKLLLCLAVALAAGGCGTLKGVCKDSSYVLGASSKLAGDISDNIQLSEAKSWK